MSESLKADKELINHEDLLILFPHEEQRIIFTRMMQELIEFVLRETQVKGWKIEL